jgi:hypothetical protein
MNGHRPGASAWIGLLPGVQSEGSEAIGWYFRLTHSNFLQLRGDYKLFITIVIILVIKSSDLGGYFMGKTAKNIAGYLFLVPTPERGTRKNHPFFSHNCGRA